ncbi:MAG: ABC transporter substrate-binding protein, partial [Candidatus Acetothermia bacterium]
PLPPQFVSSIEESSGKLVEATPGTRVFWVTMNTQEEPFDKTAVRQAMSYAIDYEALIDEVQYGYASKANSPLPPGVIGHSEHTRGYEYNPEMAEKLLDEAGYPDGFEFTLWIADEGWYPRLAESLAGFWEEIGVETNIDSYESGVYFDLLGEPFEENEVQMTINNWAQTDPYYMIEPLLHSRNWPDEGLNWAFYHNPLMEELIEEGARVAEPEQRTPYYRNAAQIIMSDAPWIIPYVIQNVVGYKEGLEGFWMEPGGVLRLEEAYWD